MKKLTRYLTTCLHQCRLTSRLPCTLFSSAFLLFLGVFHSFLHGIVTFQSVATLVFYMMVAPLTIVHVESNVILGPDAGGARAHDLTTFVSATGPGTQPQIIKKGATGQKKDVHIQDAKGWADLSKGTVTNDASLAPREENDALWTEFKGKEQEQNVLKEQRKALEEEAERKRKEAEAAAARRKEEEKQRALKAEEEKAEDARRKEAQQRKIEEDELAAMNTQAEEDAELDMMKQAGHGDADDHLSDLGLAADAGEDDDASDEEALDI